MTTDIFFDEAREPSIIKAEIVSKYFWAWAQVMIGAVRGTGTIAYVDLFAGPGHYKDGIKSTPLMVLEKAIEDPKMSKMLITFFNDKNVDNVRSLDHAIKSLPGITKLRHRPILSNYDVAEEIATMFSTINMIPTLTFIDPFGYKGVTLQLINSILKDWGCDAIIFFNYNRINPGLSNPAVQEHMDALFTKHRAARLRQNLEKRGPRERELTIVEEIAKVLNRSGAKYVLPFCFKNDQGTRTSHHLVFASKSFKGYDIMKHIMAKQSSTADQGVPSFTYNPADRKFPLLFEFTRPLEDLEGMLLKDFAGRRLKLSSLYEEHSVGKPYIKKNYQDVLRKLEHTGNITADPPAERRQKRKGEVTFGDNVTVIFPRST